MNGWPPARFRSAPLAAAGVASVVTALATVLLLSPWAMPPALDTGLLGGPVGAFLRLGFATLLGMTAGALTARFMSRQTFHELRRLMPLLQEGLPPADDKEESAIVSAAPLVVAEQVAAAARRGREAANQLSRLEQALSRLAHSLGPAVLAKGSLPVIGPDALPTEAELGRAINALLDSASRNREGTGTLLAEVEDHLLPVQEALTELETVLTLDGAPAAAFLERRRLVSRARNAVGQVERELSAVRLRMGGAPTERLTEADFVEPGS